MNSTLYNLLVFVFSFALLILVACGSLSFSVAPQTLQLTYPTRSSEYHFIADNGSIVITTQADMYLNNPGGVELIDETTPFRPEIVSRNRWTLPGLIYRNWSFATGASQLAILSGS